MPKKDENPGIMRKTTKKKWIRKLSMVVENVAEE